MGSGCRQLFNHANDHTPSCVLGADLYQVGSNCFLKRSNALRSCLPGRCEGLASVPAALRASAARARLSMLASVSSYKVWAIGAARRCSLVAITLTSRSSQPWRMRNMSPGATSRETFTFWPASRTLPPSMAVLASDRVLKKRAAHNHLSIRTLLLPCSLSVNARQSAEDFLKVVDGGESRIDSRGQC